MAGENHPRYKIIAVDFDGTLCEINWPDIGEPRNDVINYVKKQQAGGDVKLILWTCRVDTKLVDAIIWCGNHGIFFDAVNANLPEIIEEFGTDSRKIFAHEYIDDRGINPSSIGPLIHALRGGMSYE